MAGAHCLQTRMAEKLQTHFSSPALPTSACTVKQNKKRKTDLEKATIKKKLDSSRNEMGANMSDCSTMMTTDGVEGLNTDAMVAVSLLDR